MLNKKSSLILCTGSYRLTCHLFCFFPSQLESSHCGSLDVHQLYIPLTNQENFPVAFLQKKIKMVYIFKFPMFSHVARFGFLRKSRTHLVGNVIAGSVVSHGGLVGHRETRVFVASGFTTSHLGGVKRPGFPVKTNLVKGGEILVV